MQRLFPENLLVEPHFGTSTRLAIGEAPGETEAEKGRPFCGGSGNWLRGTEQTNGKRYGGIYAAAGVDAESISYANVLSCRPPDNIFPTDPKASSYISRADGERAVNQCVKNHLEPVLQSRKWHRLDLFGDKALKYVGGKTGIMTWRGSPIPIPSILPLSPLAVPTIHPAAIAREQDLLPAVVNDLAKSLEVPKEDYVINPSYERFLQFTPKRFAFDIETTYTAERTIKIIGLSDRTGTAIVVPWFEPYITHVKKLFSEAEEVIGQNCIQFDLPVLENNGCYCGGRTKVWDTMLMQHLRFPSLPHDLGFIGSQFTGKPAWKFDKASLETYCARDVDVTFAAWEQLLHLLRTEDLLELYENVQVPLAKICHLMTETGFTIDPGQIERVRGKLSIQLAEAEAKLPVEMRTKLIPKAKRKKAPVGYLSPKTNKPVKFISEQVMIEMSPWRSTPWKKKYLYGKEEPWQLGLPEQFDVKSNKISTGKIALDKLFNRSKLPEIRALKTVIKTSKLMNDFLNVEKAKGKSKIHSSFNVHGTCTGRLSSSGPNLQNVPEAARVMYVADNPEGYVVQVDFSGIENRLCAFFAKDKARLERMNTPGFSEHKYACSIFEGIPYDEVEKDNSPDSPYHKSKVIVHGTDGGMGALKISKMNDIEYKEIKKMMDIWKREIHATISWQTFIGEKAKREGVLTNPFGRKRWFWGTNAFTEAVRQPAQSTTADIIYRCMIAIMYERIGWPKEKALLVAPIIHPLPKGIDLRVQVHDALVFTTQNKDQVFELNDILTKVMQQPWKQLDNFSIPTIGEYGKNWFELNEIK